MEIKSARVEGFAFVIEIIKMYAALRGNKTSMTAMQIDFKLYFHEEFRVSANTEHAEPGVEIRLMET